MPWATVNTATKKRFLRYVYREAANAQRSDIVAAGVTADTEEARQVVIATETDPALRDTIRAKSLSGSSANGKSVSFATANRLDSQAIADLAEWAEDYISEADIADAIESVPLACNQVFSDFSGVRL